MVKPNLAKLNPRIKIGELKYCETQYCDAKYGETKLDSAAKQVVVAG
jgi:hypothetical protein